LPRPSQKEDSDHGAVAASAGVTSNRPVWIDLDNAPHVITFAPIIRELEARGYPILLTARDVNNTPELAREFGLAPLVSGHSFGAGKFGKIAGTVSHGLSLAVRVRRYRPLIGISHGSRGQAVACMTLRTPAIVFFDYEEVDLRIFRWAARRHYYPERLSSVIQSRSDIPPDSQTPYPGLKEELALLTQNEDTAALKNAGVPVGHAFAVIRPESDTAHYLDGIDDSVLLAAIRKCRNWNLIPVVVPRSDAQRLRLESFLREERGVVIPTRSVNGMDLLRNAQLLVSGGGTMNREAVVLGIPCISIFRGKLGALDKSFIEHGNMVHADMAKAFESLEIPPKPPSTGQSNPENAKRLLVWLCDRLEKDISEIARSGRDEQMIDERGVPDRAE